MNNVRKGLRDWLEGQQKHGGQQRTTYQRHTQDYSNSRRWCIRVLRDSVKVKSSCISEIVIGVWSLEHLKCTMFVDLHAVLPNDPKILCGRILYPVFHSFSKLSLFLLSWVKPSSYHEFEHHICTTRLILRFIMNACYSIFDRSWGWKGRKNEDLSYAEY